jgi:hypothetical protein
LLAVVLVPILQVSAEETVKDVIIYITDNPSLA